jgi:hypothetical protein
LALPSPLPDRTGASSAPTPEPAAKPAAAHAAEAAATLKAAPLLGATLFELALAALPRLVVAIEL